MGACSFDELLEVEVEVENELEAEVEVRNTFASCSHASQADSLSPPVRERELVMSLCCFVSPVQVAKLTHSLPYLII